MEGVSSPRPHKLAKGQRTPERRPPGPQDSEFPLYGGLDPPGQRRLFEEASHQESPGGIP